MNPGQLRQQITVQEKTISTDARGFTTEEWVDVCTVSAFAENLRGRERYAAAAVQAEQTVRFTIRYWPGLTTAMRVLFEGRPYRITALDNLEYRNMFIEISALEVTVDGGH